MIDEQVKSWLTGTPTKDTNFKWNLKYANDETVAAALAEVEKTPEGNQTKIRTLRSRLKFLKQWRVKFEQSKEIAKAALNV